MIVAKLVKEDHKTLMDPSSAVWTGLAGSRLALVGTPIGTQPTPYTRTSWKGRPTGAIRQVNVRACHDGTALYVRLEWQDATENRDTLEGGVFPDGAGVLFPIHKDAPINSMGNEREWVNAWQWRGDSKEGRSVYAKGLGTTEPNQEAVDVDAVHSGDRWQVVISRALTTELSGNTSIGLSPGTATRVGVAVWEGGVGERAGFKGFTEEWIDLRLADA
jgi:DMSO reductase family type II enzyme heme b subunit